MSQQQDNFKRGTAEMLILHLLKKEDLYGYQITRVFKDKSLGESALYLVLYKLVAAGYITNYEKLVGTRRKRVYYHLEDSGKAYYQQILKEYLAITKSIFDILDIEDINAFMEQTD